MLTQSITVLKDNKEYPTSSSNFIIVKVQFPALNCSRLMKLDASGVSYDPLFKTLMNTKVSCKS